MSEPIDYATPLARAQALPMPNIGGDIMAGYHAAIAQQQQLALQHQALAAQQAYATNPNASTFNTLVTYNPDIAEKVKVGFDGLNTDQQNQTLRTWGTVGAQLQAKDIAGAKATIQAKRDANAAAGQDTSGEDAALKLIDNDPEHAGAMVNFLIASAKPDKFDVNTKALGEEQRANAEEPGKIALTAAQTAQANATAQTTLHPLPKTAATTDGLGNPLFYDQNAPPPANATAGAAGGSPALAALVPKLIGSESSFDPNAKNPKSTATGAGQFLSGTWVPLFKQLHPDIAAGKTDEQILAMRSNPQYAAEAVSAYAQQNATTLGNAGLPVNGATLAMAHKLGPGGAQSVLNADPNAPLSKVLPADVIKANPQLAKLTAGQYAQSLAKQFGTDAINTNPDPSATGDDFLATLPAARARLVKAIANGDQPGPTGRAATTGAGGALMQQVQQYDPTATAANLVARTATRKAFTSGDQSKTLTSMNTFAGHLAELDAAIDNLHNSGLPAWNSLAQAVGNQVDPQTQKAVSRFNTWRGLAANDIVAVLRGAGGAEADIKYWQDQLKSAKTGDQLHEVTAAMAKAVQTRMQQMQEAYDRGMGTVGHPLPSVDAKSVAIINRIATGSSSEQASGNAPKVYVNPQTGQRVVLDPTTNTWKPA